MIQEKQKNMDKASESLRTKKDFYKANDRRFSSLRKLGLEALETRELLSASTFADVAALSELTADSVAIAQESEIAPIDLSNAVADTIVVTSAADDGSEGTLRHAIQNAAPGAVVTFDESLNGATITLNGNAIDVTRSVTIDGTDSNIKIDANFESRVFTIVGEPTVNISGLTLINGNEELGGAIYFVAQEAPPIVVNTTLDVVDPSDGLTSFREAITVYSAPGDSIVFDASLNGQTISLTEGSILVDHEVSVGDDSTDVTVDAGGNSQAFVIKADATFNGISVDNANGGNSAGGAFSVYGFCNLTLKNLTVSNSTARNGGAVVVAKEGSLTAENCAFENNSANMYGGAWYLFNSATATLNNVTATGNVARKGAFGYVDVGIATYSNPTTATVTNATLTNNVASDRQGGGFYVAKGRTSKNQTPTFLTLENVSRTTGSETQPVTGTDDLYDQYGNNLGHSGTISYATSSVAPNLVSNALSDGGALATLNLTDVTIQSCNAAYGGAIYATGAASVNATRATFLVNGATTTTRQGGAIAIIGDAAEDGASLTITDSTFGDNASERGGAIYAKNAVLTVANSAFDLNSANSGGAVRLAAMKSATFENSTFNNNVSTGAGGAIAVSATQNLTINGGSFVNNSATNSGGAIYATSSKVESTNVVYDINKTDKFGGALAIVDGSDLTIVGGGETAIKSGSALAGGAIYVNKSAASIQTDVLYNRSETYGGGVYALSSDLFIRSARLYDNTAVNSGGAVYVSQGSAIIAFAELTENRATKGSGGAIYASLKGGTLTLRTVDVSGNRAKGSGGAIFAYRTNVDVGVVPISGAAATTNTFDDNSTLKFGGAIYTVAGATEIADTEFSGNTATAGGAVYAGGDLTVANASFKLNLASNLGGAAYVKDGQGSFDGVVFEDNASGTNGGALYLHTTESTVTDATFTGNRSMRNGGAIVQVDGELTISGSSFVGNKSEGSDAASPTFGGAIYQLRGTSTITDVSFEGNEATTKAGAIYVGAGATTISGSTFTGNVAPRGTAIAAMSATSVEIDGEAFPTTSVIEEEDLSAALLDEAFAELFVEELD